MNTVKTITSEVNNIKVVKKDQVVLFEGNEWIADVKPTIHPIEVNIETKDNANVDIDHVIDFIFETIGLSKKYARININGKEYYI